jgi:aspartate aminotransferase
MKIADRLSCIRPSATLAVNAKAAELKEQGRKIVSLAIGEPDFPTPAHICKAAHKAIDEGFTRYTAVPGIPELRRAVGTYYQRCYSLEPPADSVLVSNGGKHSLFNYFTALLNPGDEVVIPAPYWLSYPDMVMLAGGVPVALPVSAQEGFKLTPVKLAKAITPKTRLVILNAPSNPTGAGYSQEELDALLDCCVKKGVCVASDEIYDRIVYAPAQPVSAIRWWRQYPELVTVFNGCAKSFSMTGWRVGYCVGHPQLIKAMGTIQSQSTSNVCSIAQKAAVAALEGPYDCVVEMAAAFQRRRDLALNIMSSWRGVLCPKPEGAFYLFADMSCYFGTHGIADSADLCAYFLEKAGVALVPGSPFGDDACVRFSYAVADEVLEQALKSMEKVLPG